MFKVAGCQKLSKHNNLYVFVVTAVNHRAVTYLTFPYFLDCRLTCDYEVLHKNKEKNMDTCHPRTHILEPDERFDANWKVEALLMDTLVVRFNSSSRRLTYCVNCLLKIWPRAACEIIYWQRRTTQIQMSVFHFPPDNCCRLRWAASKELFFIYFYRITPAV